MSTIKLVNHSILPLFLLTGLLMQGCQSISQKEPVPSITPTIMEHTSPVIDGIISPGEWEDARVEHFFDDSELFLMRSEDYWYIGIRADTADMIVVNIFIAREDEIKILHASAALGTASYQKEEEAWLLTREFSWSCRDTSDSPDSRAEREAFLLSEGWVATNSYIGNPNEMEFQVKREEDVLPFAVTFMIVPGNSPTFWPADLTDACSRPLDQLPGRLNVTPDKWGILTASDR
jgi:hypothetical protein